MEDFGGPQEKLQLFRLCVAFISNPVDTRRRFWALPSQKRFSLLSDLRSEICRVGEFDEMSHCHRTRLYLKTAATLNMIAKKPPKVPGSLLPASTDGFHATRWIMSALGEMLLESSQSGTFNSLPGKAISESDFNFMLGVRDPADIGGVRHEAQEGGQVAATHSLLDKLCSPFFLLRHKDKEVINPIDWLSGIGDNYQELLIYRALLLGMICSIALDYSVVVEADIGSRIVHFL